MNLEELRQYCLRFPACTEGFPFGPETLVFKVRGRMFALCSLDSSPPSLSLKCSPERVPLLREKYPAVRGAYHMNKKHWNSILLDGSIAADQIAAWINHSYQLVVNKLPKKEQAILKTL